MNKKLFLFDIDGTLLASGGAGWRALEAACAELFGSPNLDGIDIAGRTDSSIVRQLYARRGEVATPENSAQFFDFYLKHLSHFLPLTGGALLPGIVEMLEILKPRQDCVLALLTGNLVRGAELKLTHYGLASYFTGAIQNGPLVGSFSERIEPRANIVRRALERAREALPDLESSEALVIGDTPHDIEGAHAVGVPVLAVASNTHSLEELQSHRPWRAMSALPEVSDFAEMLSASSSVTV